jgi:hypothetical protein
MTDLPCTKFCCLNLFFGETALARYELFKKQEVHLHFGGTLEIEKLLPKQGNSCIYNVPYPNTRKTAIWLKETNTQISFLQKF